MLDPKNAEDLLSVIKTLKGNKTIIYITHNLEEALLADRVLVMNKGTIVLSGNVFDIFKEKEVLNDAGLNVIGNLKLINMLEDSNIKMKKEVIDFLWELTYQK
jgi:energy-coupling factor transport system ATP-binding protein